MGLPDFRDPPVIEVSLSVLFDPFVGLGTVRTGALWRDLFAERFPETEEVPPLDPVVESFGPASIPRFSLKLQATPPTPRCWFKSPDGTELIQLQADRFIHNWRKQTGDETYPRYERIRETFRDEFVRFCDYARQSGLGDVVPRQCEVTYVNHIFRNVGWRSLGELGAVLRTWQSGDWNGFLPEPEDARTAVRFIIPDEDGKPIGRLHVVLDPRHRIADGEPLFHLALTARGAPLGEGIDGVLAFLDKGRVWIVNGFADITTENAQKIWGRRDES